MKLMKS